MIYHPHKLQKCSFKNLEDIQNNIHEVNVNLRQEWHASESESQKFWPISVAIFSNSFLKFVILWHYHLLCMIKNAYLIESISLKLNEIFTITFFSSGMSSGSIKARTPQNLLVLKIVLAELISSDRPFSKTKQFWQNFQQN